MNFLQRHAYGFGFGLAALLWPFFAKRRRISVANILRTGVADDPKAARLIARRAFCHFAGHMLEAAAVPCVINRENWREHLDFSEAEPELEKILLEQTDTPILVVSGHHGCWEAATNVISLKRQMIAIARLMDSKLLQGWMKKHHFRGPVTVVSKNAGMTREVLRQWQDDRAALTILMDQYAHHGALVEFLGLPARTVTSAARLAVRYGCPVAVGSFVRVGPFRYRVLGGVLRFEKGSDPLLAARAMNDRISAAIRRYPEQYLWMHRRWRDE